MGRSPGGATWRRHSNNKTNGGHDKTAACKRNKKHGTRPKKELFLLNIIKDPENTSGILTTIVEDLLHIHGSDNGVYGDSEIIN